MYSQAKSYPRDHNPPLRNGKLDEADKKAVRANVLEGKLGYHPNEVKQCIQR